jgi:hypothetical protein
MHPLGAQADSEPRHFGSDPIMVTGLMAMFGLRR